MAPHLPVCDIQGMLCLAQENWPNVAQCNCPNLCEEATYVSMQTTLQKDVSLINRHVNKISFQQNLFSH